MEPDLVVTLIHGTYDHDASWVRTGSQLHTALSGKFGERLKIEPFNWSGGNSVFERMAATIELCYHIDNLRIAHPRAPQFLVAHSHGGNVACYALERLNGDHNVLGLACLGTPFLHARTRDAAEFGSKNWQTAILGLLILLLWIIGVTTAHGWLWFVIATVLASLVGNVTGAILESSLKTFNESAMRIAEFVTARVSPKIDLLILRTVGDEASLALAASQFLSWLTSKAFNHFAVRKKKGILGLHLKRRPLPKAIVFLWWLALSAVILVVGLSAVRPDNLLGFIFILCPAFGLAALSTAFWKTNWFDHLVHGAVLTLLTIATFLEIISVGTVPNDATEVGGRFVRGWLGAMYALLIEINTETTPAGPRSMTLLERDRVLIPEVEGTLAHRIYNDPRAHAYLIAWLQTRQRGVRDDCLSEAERSSGRRNNFEETC